jgi:hypothetical protein
MRKSLANLLVTSSPGTIDFIAANARNTTRAILQTAALPALTDSSTGVAGAALAPVLSQTVKVVPTGANLASRAAFNTAIAKTDNAVAVIATYLDNAFALIDIPPFALGTATGTVAVAGTIPAQDKTTAYTAGASSSASGTLTTTGVFSNSETVTIDTKVYTFQTALTNVDGNVLIGANVAASLANLAAAIGLGAGSGTTYAAAMTVHPTVTATATATTLVVTAKTGGTAGNSIATTKVAANATFGAATLTGGLANTDVMLRSEFNTAVVRARNNVSALVKGYNWLATALGVATLNDLTGGSADQVTKINPFTVDPVVTAPTVVATTIGMDLASGVASDAVLTALANNIAFIAAKTTNPLLLAGTLSARIPTTLIP